MKNMGIQLDLFDANEELDGKLYELYEKTPNREFKSHVQFIVADSLKDAEDKATIVDTEYWRTKSVRSVGVGYAWDTFEKIHFSYRMCKSILGLEGVVED
jgi:hypothetical protein